MSTSEIRAYAKPIGSSGINAEYGGIELVVERMKSCREISTVGASLLYSLATGSYKEKVIQADGVDAIKRAIQKFPSNKTLHFKDCAELFSQGTNKSFLPPSGVQKGHDETHTVVMVVKAERFKCDVCRDRCGSEWCYQCTSCPYAAELRCASVTPPSPTAPAPTTTPSPPTKGT
eukprot:TRINITY_DN723_c0_g1_i3.p1 TRINITY_DN723_c0_g1~~TRINITY_DN723_c0_g1_i3.p1  ORF type:complete len:175 (+),score=36.94 TRINITY_DN723_c0_g1_i3:3-527(+)